MIFGRPTYHKFILEEIGVTDFRQEDFDKMLTDHLESYMPFLKRKEHFKHFMLNVKGRLSDLPRKTNQSIALNFSKPSDVRNMSNFMTSSLFDHEGMLEKYQEEIISLLSCPDGMITGDGCDIPKKGHKSVGVARQHCGRLGKTDNCQASVMVGIAGPEGHGLIDYELYMTRDWMESPDFETRREECKVPEDLTFKTKNQLLLEMIRKICSSGNFKGRYVGVDSAFGRDHVFLDSLPSNLVYFADVPSTQLVFAKRPDMVVPEYGGRGRKPTEHPSFPPQTVKDIIEDPSVPWEDVVLGIGAKGPVITKDKCVKVVEARDGKPGKDIWLYARRLEDMNVKYAFCNESTDASIEMIRKPALMRWSIEQCFRECKEFLGMDHYETRSWPAWRRHMLFTLICQFFITKLRRRFITKENLPGPAPCVLAPVTVKEYREAVVQTRNNQPIEHSSISTIPKGPQMVMTIGLIRTLIQPFLPRMGMIYNNLRHWLKSSAQSFNAHTKAKIEVIMARAGPSG